MPPEREQVKDDVWVRFANIDGEIRNIRDSMKNLERSINERAVSLNQALEKSAIVLEGKLEGMNEFRRQLDRERGTYVTNAQLEAKLEAMNVKLDAIADKMQAQLELLKGSRDYGRGRDNGMGVIVVGLISVTGIVIGIIALFTGH